MWNTDGHSEVQLPCKCSDLIAAKILSEFHLKIFQKTYCSQTVLNFVNLLTC